MGQIIFKDIILTMISYLPISIIVGVLWLIIYCILYNIVNINKDIVNKRKDIFKLNLIFIFVLFIYITLVIAITLLSREPGSRTEVNLKLFGTISDDMYGNAFVIENILLFIPLGFLLPLISSKFNFFRLCILVGLAASIIIEIAQYITQRGFFQTDDIIMNVLGTGIGFLIYNVFLTFLRAFIRIKDNKNKT